MGSEANIFQPNQKATETRLIYVAGEFTAVRIAGMWANVAGSYLDARIKANGRVLIVPQTPLARDAFSVTAIYDGGFDWLWDNGQIVEGPRSVAIQFAAFMQPDLSLEFTI